MKGNRKRIAALLCALAAASSVWAAWALRASAARPAAAETRSGGGQDAAVTVCAEAEMRYVLRLTDGRVAVFAENGGEPVLITDIRSQNLRDADKRMLESGIRAASYEEVLQLLEDFNS